METKTDRKHFLKDHVQILVISDQRTNYIELLKDLSFFGNVPVKVDQANWDEISLSVYNNTKKEKNHFGLVVDLAKKKENAFPGTNQNRKRTITVDFVLIRNLLKSIKGYNHINVLLGLINAGIPSINDLYCVYCTMERVIVHGEMKKLCKKYGKEKFPLIDQHYHCYGRDIGFVPSFPCVIKTSGAHSSFGKVMVENPQKLREITSLIQLHNDYSTSEPFISNIDYELRLQKIGNFYRCMKKKLICPEKNWKSNVAGSCTIETIPITKKYKFWLDECSHMFSTMGELDMFALDVLVDTNGNHYILELNDSSIGLSPQHKEEDNLALKGLVYEKILKKVFKNEREPEEESIEKDSSLTLEIIEKQNILLTRLEKKKLQAKQKKKLRKFMKKWIMNFAKWVLIFYFSLFLYSRTIGM